MGYSWICGVLMGLCLASCVAGGGRRELTTRAWDAIGFHEDAPHSAYEEEIIIGVLDSGIWPESPSFNDKGLGPPPKKWKGTCNTGESATFKCNNKLIGARFYINNNYPAEWERSPRDFSGHGTHIAGTVAGSLVKNVSLYGVGLGTARGAVPRARLAVYKTCWGPIGVCDSRATALNDAVSDGVDVLVMSQGAVGSVPYGADLVSPYLFKTVVNAGVLIAFSAGNNNGNLMPFKVANSRPWLLTVANGAGCGSDYATYVTSGDDKLFQGFSLNFLDPGKTMYPLVLASQVMNTTATNETEIGCTAKFINPELVKGKIILCPVFGVNNTDPLSSYDHLGSAGLILRSESEHEFQYYSSLLFIPSTKTTPVVELASQDFDDLAKYYQESNSAGKVATASIAKTVELPDTCKTPRADFTTSRGPSLFDMEIMKPDISAPGVNLIAAAHNDDPGYDIKTGTSMAAPFAAGIAAYVKSFHPSWSPAAIKSALMTTATPMTDPFTNQAELAYGTGLVNPLKAADPGLVYEIAHDDYIKYLCRNLDNSNEEMWNATHAHNFDCAKLVIEEGWTLNYPSFSIPVVPDLPFSSVFRRTLTNVGNPPTSNYKAIVNAPKELTVQVEPTVLAFTENGQSLSYTLTVQGLVKTKSSVLSASVVWTDGTHQVRSPIVVFERPADMLHQLDVVWGPTGRKVWGHLMHSH
uniref:Uncharacterized protein n=1 Tax=Kalanchoe fedtschenkoi TaxID=63787 RepID=A0A7N0U7S8_KALFE